MQDLIEKYKDQKAQLAGEIMTLEDQEWEFKVSKESEIKVLETQADLYDSMIELAGAFEKLRESVNLIANLQKNV